MHIGLGTCPSLGRERTHEQPEDEVELVVDGHAVVGEGPIWDPDSHALVWVDILGPTVHWFRPSDGRTQSVRLDLPVGAVAVRRSGGLVLAMEDGFWLRDDDGASRRVASVEADDPDTRMNDGKCDSRGRFWAGTLSNAGRQDAGGLYRLDPDLSVTRVLAGVTTSNGLGWSPDDRTFYYIDLPTQAIDVFDYAPETGAISRRRHLVEIPPADGLPDGMTVDAEGFIWVALWGGWAVRRYAPDGALDRIIRLPVSQVTSCAFGGDDLQDLYITTAAMGLSDVDLAAQPGAGGLFRCRPGVLGMPPNQFHG